MEHTASTLRFWREAPLRRAFPPPPRFAGRQHGAWGDKGCFRRLSSEEEEKVGAWWACRLEDGHCRRDRYFAQLG